MQFLLFHCDKILFLAPCPVTLINNESINIEFFNNKIYIANNSGKNLKSRDVVGSETMIKVSTPFMFPIVLNALHQDGGNMIVLLEVNH